MSDLAPTTHNLPDLATILAPDTIAAMLGKEIEPLKERADELISSCRRFIAAHPTIGNDEADALAAQVLATCQRLTSKSGRIETARIEFLKPLRATTTTVGSYERGPFAAIIQSVDAVAGIISKASIAYKQAKEAEERKRRQAEADKAAAEARMAEELATRGSKTVSLDDAVTAAEVAEKAQEAASVKPAEMTRARGDALGVSSLKYRRKFTVMQPDKVGRALCSPDDSKIRAAIGKAGSPLPVLDGIYVFDEPEITIGV